MKALYVEQLKKRKDKIQVVSSFPKDPYLKIFKGPATKSFG